jgi:hypothetical protein
VDSSLRLRPLDYLQEDSNRSHRVIGVVRTTRVSRQSRCVEAPRLNAAGNRAEYARTALCRLNRPDQGWLFD